MGVKTGTIIDVGGKLQIATPDGWADYDGPDPRSKGGARKPGQAAAGGMSVQAQNFLNELSTQAANAAEVGRVYERARGAVDRFKPGPYRGRLMEIATPEEGGGVLDTLGAAFIGAPLRMMGAITPQETNDYQTLRGLQSQQVLVRQLEQKGVQTESDAARLMLTELSPSKSKKVNDQIINEGSWKTKRDQAKSTFMTRWANKFGRNGLSPHGNTAEQVWATQGDRITEMVFGPRAAPGKRGGPTIRKVRD